MATPFIILGKPRDPERYELHQVDGVNVHIMKSAKAKTGGAVIYVEKFLWTKRLEIRGLQL